MSVLIVLALAAPAAVGSWLVLAGRRLPHRQVNNAALATSVVTFVSVVVVVIARPSISAQWVPALGVHWRFAVDGVSAPLLLLTAAVAVAVALHSRPRPPEGGSSGSFHGSLLIVAAGALGVFLARDALVFFIAFEVVLVPMWFLIWRFGDQHRPVARADAAGRFILYTAFGSTLMLVGILLLIHYGGTADLDALALSGGAGIGHTQQVAIALLLLLGLAVKVPLFPVHTWLPPAHTIAPTAGSVLLAAILLKLGTYGIVRLPLATTPDGFHALAPLLAAAGAIGIIWGGLVCLVERDLKRLIAYSSVAHMGFVALGLASGSRTGLQAALFANVAHGIVSALLFFIVGGLKERWDTSDLAVAHDALREVSPRLGFALITGLAASLGLPGLAGFWGEFLGVYAVWSPSGNGSLAVFRAAAVAGAVGAVLSAGYALRVANLVWVGDRPAPMAAAAHPPEEPGAGAEGSRDMVGSERAVITAFTTAALALGVLPGPLLALTASTVRVLVGGR